ncbi:hypothetical protein [Rhodanobacter sp. MP1X3]|uniref:hypothetical protein n=1 Tax=Rhodanobacter sp. MP1X3 TaxID=2723086 RepID=UPI001846C64D|nr:hypothetical protein [Rhodanobacter sp. MP1X3]MBB6243091.1 hypothetical protein [Rhodanobacter sp. MP1X3]
MSTELGSAIPSGTPILRAQNAVGTPLGLRELTVLLVKHYGYHEGKYDLLVEYQIGAGPIGPTPENRVPGIMVGFAKLGLSTSTQDGPLTVDAAVENPKPKSKAKQSTRK